VDILTSALVQLQLSTAFPADRNTTLTLLKMFTTLLRNCRENYHEAYVVAS
jgi:hypothetical protein